MKIVSNLMMVLLGLVCLCQSNCEEGVNQDPANCGNHVLDQGETCDPPETCPVGCDDNDSCTVDSQTGSAANCNLACHHQPITQCIFADGCCPVGCDFQIDDDCSSTCGNGQIDPGETCDPPDTCPASCDDNDSCTVDSQSGSVANCNLTCHHQAVTQCRSGDGCCPAGCDFESDDDCSKTCGNGQLDQGETCDPPETCPASCDDHDSCTIDSQSGSAANCNLACHHQPITGCLFADGCCPAGCDFENDGDCPNPCGNGHIDPGETCDPPDTCPASCDDHDSCTVDSQTGSAANCNLTCHHQAVTQCRSGDGCCPAGCTSLSDDDCEEPDFIGGVTAYEYTLPGDGARAGASAWFRQNVSSASTSGIEVGECWVYVYDPDAQPQTVAGWAAGTVTITGGLVDPILLTPQWIDPSGWYYLSNLPTDLTDLFDDGDALNISIQGGSSIPAMEKTINTPSALTGVQPDFLDASYDYQPGSPLSLSWTPASGTITLVLTVYTYVNYTVAEGASIICTTADDGQFQVPSEALAYLPVAGNWKSMSLQRSLSDIIEVGGTRFSLSSSVSMMRWTNYP